MNDSDASQAYVEYLHHEHMRLNNRLVQIEHELAGWAERPDEVVTKTHITRQIEELREELQRHFREEEAGGCLEEAASQCPSLGPQTVELLQEHVLLSRELGEIVAQAYQSSARPACVATSFQAFADRLRGHEAAENRVLQMGFGSDAAKYSTEDVD
jgi:hypothetical protein